MLVFVRTSLINLLILLIATLQPLYSDEQAAPINLFNLEDSAYQNGQLVAIRGFLYESPESHLILAAEPNLKSCCVGSASKRQRQLLVSGDLDPAISGSSAITLQGNLVVALEESFPFRLENAVVVPKEDQCYLVLGLVGLGLAVVSGCVFFMLRKKTG